MFKVPTQWRQVFHAQLHPEIVLSAVFLLGTTLIGALLGISVHRMVGLQIVTYGVATTILTLGMYVLYRNDNFGFRTKEAHYGIQNLDSKNSQKELVTDGGQPKDVDPVGILLEAGVGSRRLDNEISLNDDFQSTWKKIISGTKETGKAQMILPELLDIEAERTTFKDHGSTYELRIDGLYYGNWESEVAFRVDMAAAYLFEEKYERWDELSLGEQGEVLKVLRQLLETCPDCDNSLTIVHRETDSPGEPQGAMEMACDHCETQLYASPHSPGSISE